MEGQAGIEPASTRYLIRSRRLTTMQFSLRLLHTCFGFKDRGSVLLRRPRHGTGDWIRTSIPSLMWPYRLRLMLRLQCCYSLPAGDDSVKQEAEDAGTLGHVLSLLVVRLHDGLLRCVEQVRGPADQ